MYIGQLSKKIDEKFQLASDSKFGGDPVWISEKEPTNFNWYCPLCKNKLTFLFQLATSYEEYMRVIYIFCCLNNKKCNINKNSWLCIKGKKKVIEFNEHIGTAYNTSNNYYEFCNNRKEPFFGILTENVEKNNINNANNFGQNIHETGKVMLETINNSNEKSINWNQLFSQKKNSKREDISLFGTFGKSLEDITTKITIEKKNKNIPTHYSYNELSKWNHVTSVQEEYKKYDIYDREEKQENEKKQKFEKTQLNSFLNTNARMVYENMPNEAQNETQNETQNDILHKLPCYYIHITEDDDEFCNDYLYERAKQLHKHYEDNKEEFEQFEESVSCDVGNRSRKKTEVYIEDEEEKFENDFNGCVKFYSYLKKNSNQILRYYYNGKFLYMHKYTKNYLMNKQMKCNNCQRKLVFELQFFSTIVYKLEQLIAENASKEKYFLKNMLNNFNVGNVFIFTCDSDCVAIDDMYSYEHVELEIF